MNIKELTGIFQECLDCGNLKCFENELEAFLSSESDDKASQLLSEFLFTRFTTFKADSTAKLLEIIIRKNPNLALVKFPDNYLFRVALLKGSIDLYDCYIEEFVIPYLSKNKKIDKDEFIVGLVDVSEKYDALISEQEQSVIKGVHFNSAFGNIEQYPNALLINKEDYEVLNNTVEKYNAVIGRKQIVKRINALYEEN